MNESKWNELFFYLDKYGWELKIHSNGWTALYQELACFEDPDSLLEWVLSEIESS